MNFVPPPIPFLGNRNIIPNLSYLNSEDMKEILKDQKDYNKKLEESLKQLDTMNLGIMIIMLMGCICLLMFIIAANL